MEDGSNLECVSDSSTGSFTIDNRKQQLWNALNVQKDLIFRQCTTIIQVIVTILKLLQDKHDPKKILDKEHLRRSEHDFQLVVRLLTDGLKKMKDFSMECRAVQFKICNQSESDYSPSDGTSTNEDSKLDASSFLEQTEKQFRNGQDEDVEVFYNKNWYEPSPFFIESIDLDLLEIGDDVLGRGHFSEVRMGRLRFASSGTSAQVVAVKVLNSNNSEKHYRNETDIMSELAHLNIIAFIGAKQNMIVMEYADIGSLQKYLCSRRRQKQPLHLYKMIQICIDVAAGMKYLADSRIIHGDIAARNILLNSNFQAKITDFGLSRRLNKGSCSVRKSADEISPTWWSPPEVLTKGILSIKSDVWSFGVLMWEVFTHGKTPILCNRPRELRFTLKKKIRLPKTDNCPTNVYALMTHCWKENAIERIDFNQLYLLLSQIFNTQNQNKHGKLEEIFSPGTCTFYDRCTNGDCSEDLDDSNGSCGYFTPVKYDRCTDGYCSEHLYDSNGSCGYFTPVKDDRCTNGDCSEDLDDSNGSC